MLGRRARYGRLFLEIGLVLVAIPLLCDLVFIGLVIYWLAFEFYRAIA